MTIRTILAAASGGSASDAAIELAFRLARRFSAHVEAFHVRTDAREVMMAMAGEMMGGPLSAEWIDRIGQDAADLAGRTKRSFVAGALRHEVPLAAGAAAGVSAYWREATGYAPVIVPERARFFDLTVLGRSERVLDRAHSDVIEQVLLHSGRPVLIAPAKVPQSCGEMIALGWDGSATAVHAVAQSLPLLAAARSVTVITIGEDPQAEPAALVDYLERHGVAARHHPVRPVEGVAVGPQLLSTAREDGADLLVMGGYGHKPWREFFFGGATRDTLGSSLLPLLLAH